MQVNQRMEKFMNKEDGGPAFPLEGADSEYCPSCLRPAERAQFRVEIAVSGHCSTCNPIYSPEQNLQIKYALEPKEL